jgi:hypothetical protein
MSDMRNFKEYEYQRGHWGLILGFTHVSETIKQKSSSFYTFYYPGHNKSTSS